MLILKIFEAKTVDVVKAGKIISELVGCGPLLWDILFKTEVTDEFKQKDKVKWVKKWL